MAYYYITSTAKCKVQKDSQGICFKNNEWMELEIKLYTEFGFSFPIAFDKTVHFWTEPIDGVSESFPLTTVFQRTVCEEGS